MQAHNSRIYLTLYAHGAAKPMDLSPWLLAYSCEKASPEAPGRASFSLAGHRQWLNVVRPRDYVRIEADNGHETHELFFGTVKDPGYSYDLIASDGTPGLSYSFQCGDVQDQIDHSAIVFWPDFSRRFPEWKARFGDALHAPVAVERAGMRLAGSPGDILESLLVAFLGYGGQWQLPACLSPSQDAMKRRRVSLLRRSIERLESGPRRLLRELIPTLGAPGIEARVQLLMQKLKAQYGSASVSEAIVLDRVLLQLEGYRAIAARLDAGAPATILDILNLDFIEHGAIDGWTTFSVNQLALNLGQAVRGFNNACVLEVMFDLRPVARGHSRYGDGKNAYYQSAPQQGSRSPGPLYEPAVVLREMPYSTVEGLDLSGVSIGGGNRMFPRLRLGRFAFGPVFTQGYDSDGRAGASGRALYDYRRMGVPRLGVGFNFDDPPVKHLDVCVIEDAEILSEQIGTTDAEVCNWLTIAQQGFDSWDRRRDLLDVMPVVSPVSFAKHGLRESNIQTAYGAAPVSLQTLGQDDTPDMRSQLLRWALLRDHWFQHNHEYGRGRINTVFRPDVRAGYRIDLSSRKLTAYCAGHEHSGVFNAKKAVWNNHSSFSVARVQSVRWPTYVPPALPGAGAAGAPLVNLATVPGPRLPTASSPAWGEPFRPMPDGGGADRMEGGRLGESAPFPDMHGNVQPSPVTAPAFEARWPVQQRVMLRPPQKE